MRPSTPVSTLLFVMSVLAGAGVGLVLFGESRDPVRLAFIALIVGGIVGLEWSGRR